MSGGIESVLDDRFDDFLVQQAVVAHVARMGGGEAYASSSDLLTEGGYYFVRCWR